MMTTLKWRLKEAPTPESLAKLVKDELLTKEEARQILFSSETEEERDKKGLESEIKFLRDLVEKLSSGNRTTIVETIRTVEKPYQRYPWWQNYEVWCGGSNMQYAMQTNSTNDAMLSSMGNNANTMLSAGNFSEIKTF